MTEGILSHGGQTFDVLEEQDRRTRTINRVKTSTWPRAAQLSTPTVEKPAGDSTRPLVPQILPAVDWVPLVQLNHPLVPVALPIHHEVAPDDGSVFSSGTVLGSGGSSSTGLPFPLLNTPGVGGELCAKHHCFTRASWSSDDGSSVTSGDIGPVGDDRLLIGVDDEEDEAEVVTEEVSEGGSGEATLGGVDRGEERGEGNMGMPSLKMGAEVSIFDLISFDSD